MKGHTPIPKNEAAFTTEEIVRLTGGNLVGAAEKMASRHRGVTTDSRGVEPGNIFVALVGEKLDAHRFVDGAIAQGASLVLVRKGFRPSNDAAAVVEVEDTLVGLGALAKEHCARWRARVGGKVIAITGSAGKTTTKELTRALLAMRHSTHATLGNLNNRIGVPFVLLGLVDSHTRLVAELGMSLRGEIATLAALVDPDVAIITNIGTAHAEGVGGEEFVAPEKGDLFASLRSDAVAIQNLLDVGVAGQMSRTKARAVTFGRDGATYRLISQRVVGAKGSVLEVVTPSGAARLEFPFLGEAHALDLLAAWAAVDAVLDRPLTSEEVNCALQQLSPLSGRARVTTLRDQTVLIDDSYNANPTSMRASIASASELARTEGRRLVLVLGEMKELGVEAEREHRDLGASIQASGATAVITCGGLAGLMIEAVDSVKTYTATNAEGAVADALSVVRPGDVVLVKGSRSVGTEVVAEAIAHDRGAP